jgi:two-component system nitrogen regulation sensor histidine kinase NtrY
VTLRWRLRLYLLALHLALLGAGLWLLAARGAALVGLELALLASLALGHRLVQRALEPLAYTEHFHHLLQEQNYASRLRTSGGAELRRLVEQFNRMLAALYQERLRLGEQQGLLDRLLEATPSAVLVFDFDGRISLLNASALALLGLEQAQGRTLQDYLQGRAGLAAALGDGGRARCLALLAQLDALAPGASQLLADSDGRRYRGQRGQFYDRSFVRHFLLVDELTTELEDSERNTYDKLVRVLAHEVNNTVGATGSVLDSLLYYADQLGARDGEDFRTAVVAVKRRNVSLGEFIERFARVVKMPAPELRPTGLREMLDDILWLYREQCRSRGIRIEWRRCDALAPLALDRQLMEQALLNIVKNAMEAAEATMRQSGGDGYIALSLAAEAGGARLSVCDSGRRLGEVPPRQLFSPFFSTKKGGQGIGLLFVREVLHRHGCAYRLAPDAAGDTCFDIWLPAAPA